MAASSELVRMEMSRWTLAGFTVTITLDVGTPAVDATCAAIDEVTAGV